LFKVLFLSLKKVKLSFFIALLGGGHLGPLTEKGGTGGIWEISGRPGRLGWPWTLRGIFEGTCEKLL